MDLDGDGQISLDELETYMNQIRIQLQNSKSDAVNFDEVSFVDKLILTLMGAPVFWNTDAKNIMGES